MHVQSFFPAFSHLSRFVFILLFMDFGCIYFITEPGDAGASVGRVLPLLSIDSLKGVMYLSFWEVCTQSNYSPAQTRSLNYPFITPVVYYLSFLLFCLFVYSRHFPRPRNTDWMISSIFAINNHLITNPNRAFSCRHTPALVTFLWGGWGIFFFPFSCIGVSFCLPSSFFDSPMLSSRAHSRLETQVPGVRCVTIPWAALPWLGYALLCLIQSLTWRLVILSATLLFQCSFSYLWTSGAQNWINSNLWFSEPPQPQSAGLPSAC